jgi:hypothetical protein
VLEAEEKAPEEDKNHNKYDNRVRIAIVQKKEKIMRLVRKKEIKMKIERQE